MPDGCVVLAGDTAKERANATGRVEVPLCIRKERAITGSRVRVTGRIAKEGLNAVRSIEVAFSLGKKCECSGGGRSPSQFNG
jgi:hypothetical protein